MSHRQIFLAAFLLALAPSILLAAPPAGSGSPWTAKADHHRGENGQHYKYFCPAGGSLAGTWGTDIYTDDSSVCTAAVHAGLIVQNTGGYVVIEIRPGRQSYTASVRNGVRTGPYGNWDGSFIFTGQRSSGTREPLTSTTWATTAASHRGQNGQRFTYACPGNGAAGNVWGVGIYTDDSSVCTAAVHHGLISFRGGNVSIEIRQGQSSYRGSWNRGVESKPYGSFAGSFMFLQ